MAIGLSIEEKNLKEFTEKMLEFASDKNLKNLSPTVKVDAEITSVDVTNETIKELEMLKPFGESNPAPIFVYKNLKVDGIRLLSNDKHLKLSLKDGSSIYEAIAFNMVIKNTA